MFETATQLWRTADRETRRQAAEAFWNSPGRAEQVQAEAYLAKRLNLRSVTARKLPPERRAAYLAGFDNMPEAMCAQLLAAFYLTHRREMLGTFLDALSIPHKQGLMEDEKVSPPTVEALTAAIRQLVERYGADEVRRYLSVLFVQDPAFWGGLKEAAEQAGVKAE